MADAPADIDGLTFELALSELERIVVADMDHRMIIQTI